MKPLAERLRPKDLDGYLGQTQIVGKDKPLRKIIEKGDMHSCIFWGPPGVGKTTLALIIAKSLKRPFSQLSAINAGVKDIREAISKAKNQQFFDRATPILFIDEIHRFSKSQQDALLGAVETGTLTLIGATTENPSFEVIPALLSRCQVYVLEYHSPEELKRLADTALAEDEFLKEKKINIKEYDLLLRFSGGDARKLLNCLEIVIQSHDGENELIIDNALVEASIQQNIVRFDKSGEMHYDLISAFIKSIRGSDPDATVYYLARMLSGGEDPLFICRRMIIAASEDIGLANPNALLLANNCFQAVHKIGAHEGRIPMSQTAIYLALSPKSNSAYMAINAAMASVKETGNVPVPLHLRNAPTQLMKDLNYGANYKYAHDFDKNYVDQSYLPDSLTNMKYYKSQSNAAEEKLNAHLKKLKDNKSNS